METLESLRRRWSSATCSPRQSAA